MPTREQFLQFLQQNPLSDGTPIYVDSFQGFETYYSQLNQANINVTNIPSTSTTPAAAPTPHMTVDDLLGAPGRESLTVLDPLRRGRATWFKYDKGKISKAILKMMKSDLPRAYPTYNHLPRDQQFDWERSITETVKVAYEKKAQKSFSSNLCAWKDKWKLNKDPPDWISEKAWEGYVLMWQDEKVEAKSSRNSTNRKSERGGEEPGMLAFLEDVHRNRKTGDICDKKVKQIVETVKEKINDQLTQGRSTETNHLTQAEINTLVLRETPIIKGHRFGFGTLPELGQPHSSARFMPNLDQDEQLRIACEKIALADEKIAMVNEKIVTLENDKVDQDEDEHATQE
ncbi:hypothetical protein YC2023_077626 [Brassica napus]